MMTMISIKTGRKALLAGVALAAGLGFTINAQAQTCVVSNWTGAVNLSDADAGVQGATNRRYGGPCGLRAPVSGAHVVDDSPLNEQAYKVRFYVYLDDVTTNDPIVIFAADNDEADTTYDAADNQIEVVYDADDSAGGTIMLSARDSGGTFQSTSVTGVGTGWHSVEIDWTQAASADIILNVDGGSDQTISGVDTSSVDIDNAFLGVPSGVASGGTVDFDDFDSRRTTRPGRLLVGDANNDGIINSQDFVVVINEIVGTSLAAGQPDCNEDGIINAQDFVCVINIITS
jgi:hypothetical protein